MTGFFVILREPLEAGAMPSPLLKGLSRAREAAAFWSKNGLDYHPYRLVRVDPETEISPDARDARADSAYPAEEQTGAA